ncbi:MAG: hypothetical protein A2Y62_05290 [Candidatus Fischerbacteria bacterium RBG_13_37_8]|uniref:Peptidase M20 dimerisation domain-containing protein n=1 Tax=Candidatus Fischerbacteria bacterium RBG_13_37_8 TaxID=1817863 RepID=A0A1F5VXP3_9BACT|nr:MAG: hypothetical protein A2Y62_05290 [Candidatus Fischerbacteria bacterium RBG_13_37_8]
MQCENIKQVVEKNIDESVKTVREFLRIPNVITDKENIKKAIHYLGDYIIGMGGTVDIKEYGELPILYGELNEGAEKTAIIYKNFDIILPETSGWKFNPFEAHMADEPGVGKVIYGRGAAQPKGPLASLLAGLKACKNEFGKLPVNIKFIFECDEQIGSPNLPLLVEEKKAVLRDSVVGIYPEFNQTSKDEVIIPLSVKGIIYCELICRGGEWGGPGVVSLHSSNAAWIKSPVWRMIQALHSMIDSNEDILISGFYEGVKEIKYPSEQLSAERINDMVQFMSSFTKKFKYDLTGKKLFHKYVSNPTLNISSLMTIPSRRWMKFVLPHEVRTRIDIRLVPDMDPDNVIKSIREHLDGYGFKDIEMLVQMKYPAWCINIDNRMIELLEETYKELGIPFGILPSSGTALPLYVFDKILNKPLVIVGLGKVGRAYHSNEYLPINSIKMFQLSLISFLDKVSRQG